MNPTNGRLEIGPQIGFKCNQNGCSFASIFKHLMSQHVSTHLYGKTFRCDLCDKAFGLQKYLTQHKSTVHNIKNNPILNCPELDCQYSTTYSVSLKQHLVTHQKERPHKCGHNGCDKSYKTSVLLRWHQNKCHLKNKPNACDYSGCGKSYESRDQLKRHLKTHTKAFRCHLENCSKSYKHKQDLNRHLKEKH